jgi:hypothetical protein
LRDPRQAGESRYGFSSVLAKERGRPRVTPFLLLILQKSFARLERDCVAAAFERLGQRGVWT